MLSPAIGEGLTWKQCANRQQKKDADKRCAKLQEKEESLNEYKVLKIPTTNKKVTYV